MIDLNYWPFFFLAIFGAIVANSTGAGGGVVFVPAFNMLNIGSESIIATSFAIQCFGMTAGTLAWSRHAAQQRQHAMVEDDSQQHQVWSQYWWLVSLFSLPAIIGILMGQYLFALDSAMLVKTLFKSFSALFGVAIIATTVYVVKAQGLHQKAINFNSFFYVLAVLVAYVGGLITAWLSIGVGELVAVILILMRFPVRLAIGVAVSVSAICVLFGVQKYLWVEPNIDLRVLLFAAPAAIIGGTLAKRVTTYFSAVQIKVFIAIWILISAIAM